jgi:hypothetical protein
MVADEMRSPKNEGKHFYETATGVFKLFTTFIVCLQRLLHFNGVNSS